MEPNNSIQTGNQEIDKLQHPQYNDPSEKPGGKPVNNNTPTKNKDGQTTKPLDNKYQSQLNKKKRDTTKRRKEERLHNINQ